MAEQLDLPSPAQSAPGTDWYRVVRMELDWEAALISISLIGENGERFGYSYSGQTATDFMVQLNKLDLSTKSMHKRTLEKLVNDGVLSGTVSGTPD